MKRLKITIWILIVLLGFSISVEAKARKVASSKKEQQAFTQEYYEMKAKGGREFTDWRSRVSGDMSEGSSDRANMMSNLDSDRTASGKKKSKKQLTQDKKNLEILRKKPKGFMGDPKDPGPKDWSDYNIKTDANGNVIGFEEKDFEDKDANGDGKIDKKEREEWNKKKKKEHDEAGGAPGKVPPVADWDKNSNGIPDNGWTRWCWQCCPAEDKLNECHSGRPGNCDNGGSCKISEECIVANETHDGKEYECHQCEYKTDTPPQWCELQGFLSDPKCSFECSPKACEPIDVDIKSGMIVPDNKTRERGSTRRCYMCLDGERGRCADVGFLLEDDCDECIDGGNECVPAGGEIGMYLDDESASCYECIPKDECQSNDDCDDGQFCNGAEECLEGSCLNGEEPCASLEECDEDADACIAGRQQKTCQDFDLLNEWDCDGCIDGGNQCVPAGGDMYADDDSLLCYECQSGEEEIVGCVDDSECDDGLFCNGNEICSNGECTVGESPCSYTETCAEDARTCVSALAPQSQCEDGLIDGSCPGTCSSDQDCVPAGSNCHSCRDKKKTCEEMGFYDGETCTQVCKNSDGSLGKCTRRSSDDYGAPCWECTTKEQEDSCNAQQGWAAGQCYSGRCRGGEKCTQSTTWTEQVCYKCHPEDEQTCAIGWEPGNCMMAALGRPAGFGQMCIDNDIPCHKYVPIDTPICESPLQSGQCPQECGSDQHCQNMGQHCFMCEEGEDTSKTCYNRQQQDGPCYADACQSNSICKEFDYDGTKCHWCQMRPTTGGDQCVDLGLPGACRGTCTSQQMCINRRGPCHICMDVESIEIEYVVIVVETPYGRYVLKKNIDFSGLTGFSPNSIMALAKVDSKGLQKLQKLANLAQGDLSIGKISDIANMVSEKLGTKKARFNDNCFKEFLPKTSLLNLPSLPSMPSLSSVMPSMPSIPSMPKIPGMDALDNIFGSDPAKLISVDGPIMACGQTQGEDSLAVFDSTGALVENIPKKSLIKEPGRILSALQKAQSAYQRFSSLQSMTPEGFVKKAASTVVTKLATPRQSEQEFKSAIKAKAKKEKYNRKKGIVEEVFNPNDPLYFKKKDKKKKLFGVLGSSTKIAGVIGASTGGGAFGGIGVSTGGSKKKGLELEDQWGIKKVGYTHLSNADSAWHLVDYKTENVVVAVIDSGLDMSHPDGPEYIWTNLAEIPGNGIDDDANGYVDDIHGWNFIDNNADLRDFKGHGTFVAGIIAAKTDNGVGISGINPGAVIMPLKVAPEEGETLSLNIYRAVRYAVDQGARVINLSLGGKGTSMLEQSAINYAHDNGVFVVIASGNTGDYMGDVGPASAHRAFVVGASDYDNLRSTISSYGPNNGIMAPGEEIYSLRSIDSFSKRAFGQESLERLYFRQSGTSFSTPMVAATASLMLVKNPGLTHIEIADILHATAVDMDHEGWDDMTGAGMLNASAALKAASLNQNYLIVRLVEAKRNWDKKGKVESVDIYATVRGSFKEFSVEGGKGKFAKKFRPIAGPFTQSADNSWIARISKDDLRGSKDWVLRLKVVDSRGEEVFARMILVTRKK